MMQHSFALDIAH